MHFIEKSKKSSLILIIQSFSVPCLNISHLIGSFQERICTENQSQTRKDHIVALKTNTWINLNLILAINSN